MISRSNSEGARGASPRQRFQPLAWWSNAQLEQLASLVGAAWAEWARGWVPDASDQTPTAQCAFAHERADCASAHWTTLGARGLAVVWIETRDMTPGAMLTRALFGKSQAADPEVLGVPGIAEAVAAQGWLDLRSGLLAALQVDDAPGQHVPEPSSFKPWSGAVAIELPAIAGMTASLLLNAACVETLLHDAPGHQPASQSANPQRAKPVTIEIALAPRKIGLRVELNGCELELGSLQDLRIGDIVPLPHSLDTPLQVNLGQGSAVCAGFLGRQGGTKAVELARSPVGSDTAPSAHHQQ